MITALLMSQALAFEPAGWAYARWGMTPSEVASASGGALTAVEPSGDAGGRSGQELLSGRYNAAGWAFAVSARFQDGRLSAVHLTLTGETDCGNLAYRLEDLYGETDRRSASIWEKRFPDTNTAIFLIDFVRSSGTCTVIYRSLRNASNEGL